MAGSMTEKNLISLLYKDIELLFSNRMEKEMSYKTAGSYSIALQAVIILVLAASANATGIMSTAHEITEHLRSQDFIADGYDVVELFRAETVQDLETAMTEGYPMPWLEEILSDETIPEEDRYWLDCRMRSIIAQDLHVFFDGDGNRTEVDADFIIPGEDYWREHMMVNPPGESDVPRELRPTSASADPGYMLDLFGNRIGELAEVYRFVSMSRDASIAAVVSGGPSACLMYPDGSFREIPLPQPGGYESVVSANGEVIAFECVSPSGTRDPYTLEPTGITGEVYFYDRNGNLIGSADPYSIISASERGKLSNDGRFFSDNLSTGELFVIDPLSDHSGYLVTASEGGRGRGSFSFSPDENFLCTGGFTTGLVIDLNSDVATWENSQSDSNDYIRIHCSNGAECIASVIRHGPYTDCYFELEVFVGNQLVYKSTSADRYNEETIVSPNGNFILSQQDDVKIGDSGIPTVIRQIRREISE